MEEALQSLQARLAGIGDGAIVGDRVYGDFSLNRRIARATKVDRLCLHASSIEINFSHEGKSHHFFSESALPRAFGKMLT